MNNFKYAHLADIHIGAYKDQELSNLCTLAFQKAIDKCIEEKVDFVLLAGDIFDTALPDINSLKIATSILKKLKDNEIPCYVIAGSHDFSPTGKTMLDVLENTGLFTNVVKGKKLDNGKIQLLFTVDEKTGVKITGMLGKKGGLESEYYKSMDYTELESEDGYKIFMFHTTISELKPKSLAQMESNPITILPKGFNYYAGGHIHIVNSVQYGDAQVTYPGPVFPVNFQELEDLKRGSFYIVEHIDGKDTHTKQEIITIDTISLKIDGSNKSPKEVEEEIKDKLHKIDIDRKILLLRIKGKLSIGKSTDIDYKYLTDLSMNLGAYFVLRNTSQLSSIEFKEVKLESEEEIEKSLIEQNAPQIILEDHDPKELLYKLVDACDDEKQDGETNATFERRMTEKLNHIFNFKEL